MKVPTVHRHHTYHLGDVAQSSDIDTIGSESDTNETKSLLKTGDAAFVSQNGVWRYAIVLEVAQEEDGSSTDTIFLVDPKFSTKKVLTANLKDEVRTIRKMHHEHVHLFTNPHKEAKLLDPTHHPHPKTYHDRQESCLKNLQAAGYTCNPFATPCTLPTGSTYKHTSLNFKD